MVDVRLDLNEELRQNDCFVSVRVGEHQKLSRLSKSRVYRFPKAGEKHFGKIEVFRRIGSCTIDIDPAHMQSREVSVSCTDSEIRHLPLTVAVDSSNPTAPQEAAETTKKQTQKARSAKDYLSSHCLEVHLSEAMQALLRERPPNPTEFLAKQLLSSVVGSVVPRSPKKQPVGEVQSETVRTEKKEVPVPKAAAAAKQRPAAVLPFSSYAREHIQTSPVMKNVFFKNAYAKFPSKWEPPKSKFQIYYCDYIHNIPKTSFDVMYNKFQAFRQSSVVTAASKTHVSGKAARWAHKPSVGTWAMRPPRNAVQPSDNWAAKPSVGTWLMQLPRGSRNLKDDEKKSVAPVAWAKHPSVGTWLAKPRAVLKAPELKSYSFRPSVGTWLTRVEVEETEPVKLRKKMVMRVGDLYGQALPFSRSIRLL